MIDLMFRLIELFEEFVLGFKEVKTVRFSNSHVAMTRIGTFRWSRSVVVFQGTVCRISDKPIVKSSTKETIYNNNKEILDKHITDGSMILLKSGIIFFSRDVRFSSITKATRFLYGGRKDPAVLRNYTER